MVMVLYLGKENLPLLLRFYLFIVQLNRSEIYDGTRLFLVLNIKIEIPWSLGLGNDRMM